MFIGRVWAHLVYSPLEWKSREKYSLLVTGKVYGEALKLLSPNHKSDSREGKKDDEQHLIAQNSVTVSLDSHQASRGRRKNPPAGLRIY